MRRVNSMLIPRKIFLPKSQALITPLSIIPNSWAMLGKTAISKNSWEEIYRMQKYEGEQYKWFHRKKGHYMMTKYIFRLIGLFLRL